MSHIHVTPPSIVVEPGAETTPSASSVPEPASNGTFARGLAYGLVLGLTFWTVVVIEILRH